MCILSGAIVIALLAIPSAFAHQKDSSSSSQPLGQVTAAPVNVVTSERNARIAELAAASQLKQSEYIIGPADLLTIEVFDVPELSRAVRVNELGYIALPLVPTRIRAGGLNVYQLQDKIAELLQTNGLVSTPQVTVTVKEQHSQPITVVGAVRAPSVIQATQKTTLLQVLSQVGGLAPDAGNTVVVTRNPSSQPGPGDQSGEAAKAAPQVFTINLADVLNSGDPRFNIPVIGGDVVSVPQAGTIYVIGAVTRPGGYILQNDLGAMTTLKMLALAGGTTSTAKSKSAFIYRLDPGTGKRDELPLNLDKVLHHKTDDVVLQAQDILFVPDSAGKRALHQATNMGVALTEGASLFLVTGY